jgi:DNA-binding XRE family transcriptional regulator
MFVKRELRSMKMNKEKQKILEKKGWKFGTAKDFLGLTDEEASYIELKLKLSANLKRVRTERKLTQVELARIISSQSRVAKLETGDPSVSLDLIIRSLLALGTSKKDIARTISS